MLTKQTIEALLQVVDRAAQFDRIPLLAVVLSDDVPARTASGAKVDREWVLIPLRELKRLMGKETSYE